MNLLVNILRIKKIDYMKGLLLQQYIAKNFNVCSNEENFRNVIVITEHEPVYTIGLRKSNYTIKDEERLKELGAHFVRTNRGGLITFHGPGQLVVYPILNLKNFTPSIRWYIKQLETTIIDLCSKFGVKASVTEDTGVWVQNNKICSIGVHGSRYVTTHGLALNCSTNLEWFDHIVPCGIENKGVTSLSKELQTYVDIEKVVTIFLKCFENAFHCQAVELSQSDMNNIFHAIRI